MPIIYGNSPLGRPSKAKQRLTPEQIEHDKLGMNARAKPSGGQSSAEPEQLIPETIPESPKPKPSKPKKKNPPIVLVRTKRCTICGKEKLTSEFHHKSNACRECINRRTNRRRKEKLDAILSDPNHPDHGTYKAYSYGCRCDKCRAAYSEYSATKKRIKKERETYYRSREVDR